MGFIAHERNRTTPTKETATVPDSSTSTEGQASSTTDTQAQAAATTTSTATSTTEGQEPKTFDADYVKTLRAEAAAHRKEAAELRAKVNEHEASKLSESEKLQKQAADATKRAQDLESALRSERGANQLARAATKANIAADDAERFITLEFDADGKVTTDLDKALAELAKAKPYLVQASATTSSAANGAARRGAATTGTLEEQSKAMVNPKSLKFWGL